jgi:hypothetical protein
VTKTSTVRPLPPRPVRKMPLMQGFQTSSPRPARLDASTIDHCRLPDLAALDGAYSSDPYARIRVPLLPTTRASSVARHAEQPDAPVLLPDIVVIAANPENVMPAALTEVEGMNFDGVELNFVHDLHSGGAGANSGQSEQGMIRDIWKGLVDDVLGGGNKPTPAL